MWLMIASPLTSFPEKRTFVHLKEFESFDLLQLCPWIEILAYLGVLQVFENLGGIFWNGQEIDTRIDIVDISSFGRAWAFNIVITAASVYQHWRFGYRN